MKFNMVIIFYISIGKVSSRPIHLKLSWPLCIVDGRELKGLKVRRCV